MAEAPTSLRARFYGETVTEREKIDLRNCSVPRHGVYLRSALSTLFLPLLVISFFLRIIIGPAHAFPGTLAYLETSLVLHSFTIGLLGQA